ncbi:MAG TPA: CRISPR-associated endoribonuclease Cas6 [Thermoplasmataceae archaeon]|nr:CRISPR-associated endoribonuclease Cas6 [Thermoplasmataceae archaeon]
MEKMPLCPLRIWDECEVLSTFFTEEDVIDNLIDKIKYCIFYYIYVSRLVLTMTSKEVVPQDIFDKHLFQSALYKVFLDKKLTYIHEGNRFRFFTFSDFFPSGKLIPRSSKKVIISSPSEEFIGILRESFSDSGLLMLGGKYIEVAAEIVDFKFSPKVFTSGSPVVLYKDNRSNTYFSLRRGDSLAFFFLRLKENALKRYRQFSEDTNFDLPHPIFDSSTFSKEVALMMTRRGKRFTIIGTVWSRLERFIVRRRDEPFYKFIMDAGLGEKPSLGFGFLNPVRAENA